MEEPLVIIPTWVEVPLHLRLVFRTISSLRGTCPGLEPLIIDDGSPDTCLLDELQARDVEVWHRTERKGFAATVNPGLHKALEEGRDAVIVQADVDLVEEGWLDALRSREGAVVGGMLLYENLLISHAGLYYSPLHRDYGVRFRYSPGNLREANVATQCPVRPELMLIRHETLEQVGMFDEGFKFSGEDIDYAWRVFNNGLECWYEPKARAFHHGAGFYDFDAKEGQVAEWRDESLRYLHRKWGNAEIPEVIPMTLHEAA